MTHQNFYISLFCVTSGNYFAYNSLVVLFPGYCSFTLHVCNLGIQQKLKCTDYSTVFLSSCLYSGTLFCNFFQPQPPWILTSVFVIHQDFCVLLQTLSLPHSLKCLSKQKSRGIVWLSSFISFFRDHIPLLPVVQCLKTVVLYIFSTL